MQRRLFAGREYRTMKLNRFLVVCCLGCSLAVAQEKPKAPLELAPGVRTLPHDEMGPFVHGDNGTIIGIDDDSNAIFSSDGGESWKRIPLFPDPAVAEKAAVRPERALLRTREGTLVVASMNDRIKKWTWSNELFDAPGAILPTIVVRSTDGGKTWIDLQTLHEEWTGAIRDMIQTRDGRIIFTAMKLMHDPGRHAVLTYSSDDEGKTWQASNLIDLGGQGHHGGVTEPTLVELDDGRVWMLIRTNWSEFWSGYSFDGGKFWRILQPSGIPASSAPGLVKRLGSGRLILVWNRPYPEGENSYPLRGGDGIWSEVPVSNHRGELSIAFSEDDGQSWSNAVVVARQPDTWLSYPYVFEKSPGTLWITTMQGNLRIELDEADFVRSE
jgi:sialidase-1